MAALGEGAVPYGRGTPLCGVVKPNPHMHDRSRHQARRLPRGLHGQIDGQIDSHVRARPSDEGTTKEFHLKYKARIWP